jgi:hypothetical protein
MAVLTNPGRTSVTMILESYSFEFTAFFAAAYVDEADIGRTKINCKGM